MRAIDADTKKTGDQAFTFIDAAAFTGVAGQLRFANGLLSGDVNGDRVVDFQIAMAMLAALTVADMML